MYINKDLLAQTVSELETRLSSYSLPDWEALPGIELYMDQVISLLEGYLEIYREAVSDEKPVTPSMINNYVKLGIIPPPQKKRYSKAHLAYLIIVCTLKQTLDMATIQKIIPINISEEDVKATYNSFVKNQHKAYLYVTQSITSVAEPIIALEGGNQERINDLLMQVSASANIFKLLTKKITTL